MCENRGCGCALLWKLGDKSLGATLTPVRRDHGRQALSHLKREGVGGPDSPYGSPLRPAPQATTYDLSRRSGPYPCRSFDAGRRENTKKCWQNQPFFGQFCTSRCGPPARRHQILWTPPHTANIGLFGRFGSGRVFALSRPFKDSRPRQFARSFARGYSCTSRQSTEAIGSGALGGRLTVRLPPFCATGSACSRSASR